jgi:hypothetical protein
MVVKRVLVILVLGSVMGCRAAVPPQVLQQYQGRTFYTCCNIRYEGQDINDANYQVGAILPFGSQAQVQAMRGRSVTFLADGRTLTLTQSYGTAQESFEAYLAKILVSEDPRVRFASWPKGVQEAVSAGHVEKGMTREQVLMSLGYPPTHRTPSLNDRQWTYWYNRWVTFQVVFDDAGKVDQIVGSPAPTTNNPIPAAAAKPAAPTPAPKKRR